jgi:hypothetical protein
LASSSLAALLVGTGAPAAFAQCAISPGTNQSSVSNSAAINCININGITVTGNVTNTSIGTITATGNTPPTQTGITVNNASVGGAIVNAGHITATSGTGITGDGILVTNNASVSGGSCSSCHGVQDGQLRFLLQKTWKTPVVKVGTDEHEYDILGRTVQTGALQGAFIPGLTEPLQQTAKSFDVLKTAALGSIIEHVLNFGGEMEIAENVQHSASLKSGFPPAQFNGQLPPALKELQGAFHTPNSPSSIRPNAEIHIDAAPATVGSPARGAYEARVLRGIWAAAPYLPNGSVPSLAELLKPPAERVQSFKVGPAYDTNNIGLAAEQTQFDYEFKVDSSINSGNSNVGHDYGTHLSPDEKAALLEYLKQL